MTVVESPIGQWVKLTPYCIVSPQDGGQWLAAVDEANEHVISLWDWAKGEKGHKITETKVSRD